MLFARSLSYSAIALGLTASSCTVFSDPEVDYEVALNPESYWESSEPYIDPSLEVPDDITYFQTDKPHALAELVDLALTNNPETSFTWAEAKSQAYIYKSTLSLYFPAVNLQESTNFFDLRTALRDSATAPGTDPVTKSRFQVYESNLLVQYLLLDFGGRYGIIEGAWQGLISANFLHNQSIQDVMIAVITDYYVYLANVALSEARREDLKNAQETYESARAQFDSGIVTIVDVLLAESNLARAVLNLQQQENITINSLAQLAKDMGFPPETKFEVEQTPFVIPKEQIITDVEYLMAVAKRERADIAAKQAEFLQSRANLLVVKSNALPNITAQGNAISNRYSGSPIKDSHNYSATVFLNIPIFQGFFYVNQIKRARADVLAAYEDWKNTEQQVLLNVFTSYYNFKTSIDNLAAADAFLKYSQEAYDAMLAQYRDGVATITDLLNAEATLADARSQDIISRTQMSTSFAQLTYSMGILSVTNDYSDLFPKKKEEAEEQDICG